MSVNATFTSPLAGANFGGSVPVQVEYLFDALKGITFWTGLWTFLALAVVYDQRMSRELLFTILIVR